MKKIIVLIGLIGLISLTGCKKDTQCRCAVYHEQTIRIIDLEGGDCKDLRFVYYDRDILNPDQTDSIICTDHEW